MDPVAELKKVFLFGEVPEAIVRLVAECVEERTASPGEAILSEGQGSSSLFMITSGSVRAFHAGEPLALAMGAGESFGQLSILLGGPSTLSAVAVERTELLVLPSDRLRERLEGNHEAGYVLFRAVARSLAARLRRAVQALELARGME